jgi:toxin ParE1/3/4
MVYKRAAARRDLISHFVYLAENAGVAAADRFLVNAASTFTDLAEQPLMGAPVAMSRVELTELRKWHVKDFESYLIFYLPRRDGVSVIRVLHAAKDWWRLLGVETNSSRRSR